MATASRTTNEQQWKLLKNNNEHETRGETGGRAPKNIKVNFFYLAP